VPNLASRALGASLACALLLLGGCAAVPERGEELVLIGAGAHPCARMTSPTPRDPADPPIAWGASWTTGYLRAYFDERFGSTFDPFSAYRELSGRDFDVAQAVVEWCVEHPQRALNEAALAIATGAVSGSADRESTGSVAVQGAGAAPCPAVFADEARHKQGHRAFNWMFGYLRGRFDARFGEHFDPLGEALRHHGKGLLSHIESSAAAWCASHPESSMWQVSMAASAQLLRECEARGGGRCGPAGDGARGR